MSIKKEKPGLGVERVLSMEWSDRVLVLAAMECH